MTTKALTNTALSNTALTATSPAQSSRNQLRHQLRQQRQQLSARQQQLAARRLHYQLLESGLLKQHKHIAFYLANDGEIDPAICLQHANQRNKHCYLPVITADETLQFKRYRPGAAMHSNRFGIPEPAGKPCRASWALDLVLLPLVGFDRHGSRLGMGGGFYDRSFGYFASHPDSRRPQLVGLAHHCQEVERLSVEAWDIPLSMIVTDQEIIQIQLKKGVVKGVV